jgi:hypothetical protein
MVAMAELECGMTHVSFEDALRCAARKRQGNAPFGSIPDGVNLWWGDKDALNLKNRGYVIGLWNPHTGDRWRIDYDPVKGLHVNQDNVLSEEKIMHPISCGAPDLRWLEIVIGLTDRNIDRIPDAVKRRRGKRKWYGRFWA